MSDGGPGVRRLQSVLRSGQSQAPAETAAHRTGLLLQIRS